MRSLLIIATTMVLLTTGDAWAGEDLFRMLRGIADRPLPERQAAAEHFLAKHPENPFCKLGCDSLAIVYSGPGRDVRLAGDITGWQPSLELLHIPGTNLWYHVFANGPMGARLDYKFVRDGQWMLDSRNPLTCMSGFGPNSELRLHGYRSPAFTRRDDLASCRLDTLTVATPRLGGSRMVVVLTPPGPDDPGRPCLLVHDGLEYLTLGDLERAISWHQEHRPDLRLPICVCVPPVRRTEEYATDLQGEFGSFVVENLMPLIESRYGKRGKWGTMGASYGGRISLHLALAYPERFDRIVAMSPSVAPEQQSAFAGMDPGFAKIYVNWGLYDIRDLMPGCETLAAMLAGLGFDHMTETRPQGHSWGFWRDSLSPALCFLYGSDR